MARALYKATSWQGGSGRWYCNDVSDLAGVRGLWWIPPRILGISPAAYVEILIKDFNVTTISYNEEKNFLYFCWDNSVDCNRYKNWINKMARQANFIV